MAALGLYLTSSRGMNNDNRNANNTKQLCSALHNLHKLSSLLKARNDDQLRLIHETRMNVHETEQSAKDYVDDGCGPHTKLVSKH